MVDMAGMVDLFHLPLSTQAYTQFKQLASISADNPLHEGNATWSYIGGSNLFASSKAYLCLT